MAWALWGHSGGGLWAGGMALLHPERVAAAWLRSGVPQVTTIEGRPGRYPISEAACQVPLMCNLGTKEGVTDMTNRFAGVWPGVEVFFKAMRSRNALIGVAIDPLTSHECGNQRYLAIPWLDACLAARLPSKRGAPLKAMLAATAWLAPLNDARTNFVAPAPAKNFTGMKETSVWLPDKAIAVAWAQYVQDTVVTDTSRPPKPTMLRVRGNELTWKAEADVASGLAHFVIERDGQALATVPKEGKNPFGRPIFQGLQYSDTPTQPLVPMRFTDTTAKAGERHKYRVIAVNTVGLESR